MAIKSILNSPLFYKVFHPVLSAAAKINNHIEIQKSYRQHLGFNSYSERIAGILSPSKCVLSGPFQGLHYPSFQASGSALIPKILGVYESELHPDIEALSGSYDCILDIGCAEGYYAIGLARMHPGATVHAYDIDPDAARKTIEMAALNNVSNRLEIHGGASWRDLLTVSNQKALIVCDCEGHERLLFSHQNISYLANSDLIIELHPFVCEDVTTYLLSLFSPSHACKLVTAIPDQDKNLELEQIQHLPLADKKLCVAEFRPNFQQWLICKHNSNSL